ncbi:hypothetical protein ACFQBS_32190 [Planomonospora parontospora]|uniref:hypothetical protein n=1 Tax=Planomonospora parontospora TaxID=58119 RepID=UPI003608B960
MSGRSVRSSTGSRGTSATHSASSTTARGNSSGSFSSRRIRSNPSSRRGWHSPGTRMLLYGTAINLPLPAARAVPDTPHGAVIVRSSAANPV